MSLVPAFEIGVWNAWILAIVFLSSAILPDLIFKDFTKKMGHDDEAKKISIFTRILFFILLICTIFLPLKLGTVWFYTGLSIYILGFIIGIIAIANVASTPLGKPFTKGVYRYSRNPMYLCMIIVFVGIGIASASWFYLLLSAIFIVMTYFNVVVEERLTQDKLGNAYRDYMDRTPKWLGIPKAEKK